MLPGLEILTLVITDNPQFGRGSILHGIQPFRLFSLVVQAASLIACSIKLIPDHTLVLQSRQLHLAGLPGVR